MSSAPHPAAPDTQSPGRSTLRIDAPDKRERSRDPDREPVAIDRNRLFYMRSSDLNGAFQHDWSFYLVDKQHGTVDVHWIVGSSDFEDGGTYSIRLYGRDVQAFLKITRDRDAFEMPS